MACRCVHCDAVIEFIMLDRKMGIPGLASFFNTKRCWTRETVKGLLVLDGNNVCYTIYKKNRISWSQGGQYGEFRAAMLRFIDYLLAGGISPIFVFDGIHYKQKKIDPKLDRHTKTILCIRNCLTGGIADESILSVLTKEVFRDVLEERRIPFFYVDGEGDPDIAALANNYRCPVVSDDSDFYIFNLTHGCIPMDRLHWEASPVYADVYYRYKFCQAFSLAPELCFAIPAIAGNDSIESLLLHDDLRSSIIEHLNVEVPDQLTRPYLIELLIQYLANFRSLEILLPYIQQTVGDECSRRVMKSYRRAGKFYTVKWISETTLFSFTLGTALYIDDDTLWTLKQYRLGQFGLTQLMQAFIFPKNLLSVVPDDPSKESAQYCSRPIRQAIYGILQSHKVVEFIRKESSIVKECVENVYSVDDEELPGIRSIRSLAVEKRKVHFCNILEYGRVENLDAKWQLVAAATYYWAKKAEPSVKQIKALILTFVRCSDGNYYTRANNDQQPVLESFHLYAQWQCIYKDTAMLNIVLMNPLQYVSPAFLFDGNLVMYYAHCDDLDDEIQQVSSEEKLLYKHLRSAILTKLRINRELNLI